MSKPRLNELMKMYITAYSRGLHHLNQSLWDTKLTTNSAMEKPVSFDPGNYWYFKPFETVAFYSVTGHTRGHLIRLYWQTAPPCDTKDLGVYELINGDFRVKNIVTGHEDTITQAELVAYLNLGTAELYKKKEEQPLWEGWL